MITEKIQLITSVAIHYKTPEGCNINILRSFLSVVIKRDDLILFLKC